CPDCDVAIEPQSAGSIAARLLRDYRGKSIALLAPLIVARKGYYTDLAKWAANKGFRALRVDADLVPTAPRPRPTRFPQHTTARPWPTPDRHTRRAGGRAHGGRENRRGAAPAPRARPRLRQGAGPPRGGQARHDPRLRTKACLPPLRHEFRRARPAPVLLQLPP